MDATLFGQWLSAYANRQPRLVPFYQAHFRPDFRDAFNAWYRDSTDRESTTPFDLLLATILCAIALVHVAITPVAY